MPSVTCSGQRRHSKDAPQGQQTRNIYCPEEFRATLANTVPSTKQCPGPESAEGRMLNEYCTAIVLGVLISYLRAVTYRVL